MVRKFAILSCLTIPLLLLTRCNDSAGMLADGTLKELDSMVYTYPHYVNNRVEQLSKINTSTYNQAYLGLLKIISADNYGLKFTSDSLINRVVNGFAQNPDLLPQNYLRSLIYQGIVRYRAGKNSSIVYQPIKNALDRDNELHVLDVRSQQIANYYLGIIHNQNNNISTSHKYFQKALILAESLNDSVVLFKTYREMYWNRMKALDFQTAQTLLQSLQSFHIDSEQQVRDVRNAEALFYNSQKRYRNALILDYELLKSDLRKNDSVSLLADYYRISDNYRYLGRLDSALFYAEMTVSHIVDTTFYLNYHYYLNVAEIAGKMGKWEKSAEAYKQVYRLQNRTINEQLNTRILELERKYDLVAADNRAMSLKTSNIWLTAVLSFLALSLVVFYIFVRQQNKLQQERQKFILQENKILEQEKQISIGREKQMLLDKQLTERKLVEKQFVIPIYRQISERNLDIKNFLLDLQNNSYISKNQPLLEKIENEYRNYIQTTKITDTQFLSDKLFADLTGIPTAESKLFNESEKMMMAFIATGSDNQQMATLLNTSVGSIRVRKSKLKKKMQEHDLKIPDELMDNE